MNELNLFDSIARVDEELIDRANRAKRKQRKVLPRFVPVAAELACFLLLFGAVVLFPLLKKDAGETIHLIGGEKTTNAPLYFGEEINVSSGSSVQSEIDTLGFFVTATLEEVLPDVYTFYQDWRQVQYRLLRMKTVRCLIGKDMPDEFYYLIRAESMTILSIFDRFVISDMHQCGFEYSVLFNKTQGNPEALHLVLFGSPAVGNMDFFAFDENGNLDRRLMESCVYAKREIDCFDQYGIQVETLEEMENYIESCYAYHKSLRSVPLLKDVSGEAAEILAWSQSFENGVFVPRYSSWYHLRGNRYNATRFINGFATNEEVRIWGEDWERYSLTKARFTEEDLAVLPALSAAVRSVAAALETGNISPPHFRIRTEIKHTSYGVFGWYAKTADGVIGIVRIDWVYYLDWSNYPLKERGRDFLYDDAYYVIEPRSDKVRRISRDSLITRFGEYETTYIFTGDYDKNGKIIPWNGISY